MVSSDGYESILWGTYIPVPDDLDHFAGISVARILRELAQDNLAENSLALATWRCGTRLAETDMLLADGSEDGIAVERLVRAELDVEEFYSGHIIQQRPCATKRQG